MVSVANELKNVYIWEYTQPTQTDFCYTWAEQCVTLQPWTYKLQVWWASSSNTNWVWCWWYSEWCITLSEPTIAYVYVWSTWASAAGSVTGSVDWWYNWWWAWYVCSYAANWWGWGTDIRIWWNTINHRRIVAGWAGGCGYYSNAWCWWYWGGITWWTWCNNGSWWSCGTWWSQTAWWANWNSNYSCTTNWSFWQWWCKYSYVNCWWSWWWGWWYWWWPWWWYAQAWWWWSGYVYNSSTCSCAPSWYCHCTDYFLTNAFTCCWIVQFPSPNWWTETWHLWNGYAKIYRV